MMTLLSLEDQTNHTELTKAVREKEREGAACDTTCLICGHLSDKPCSDNFIFQRNLNICSVMLDAQRGPEKNAELSSTFIF